MFGTIMTRMILWDLVRVFLMALVAITGILLVAGIIAEATQQGLGPKQILSAIPLLIPSTLPYTIPATTLFAVCVVYGRLSADNEILAIRSAGVNLYRVVVPAIMLGIGMMFVTMVLYARVIPSTHHMLRSLVYRDAEELIYTLLRRQGVLQHSSMPYAMYVKSVQGRKLITPVFKHMTADGQYDLVAHAKEADLRVNLTKKVIYLHMRWGEAISDDGNLGYFVDRVWEVPLGDSFGKPSVKRQREMLWEELAANKAEAEAKMAELNQQIDEAVEDMKKPDADEALPAHIQHLRNQYARQRQEKMNSEVEMLMRVSLCLGCLCFILIGCPVGIWFSRSDFLSSFITCFLPVVLVYYPLMLCGSGLAREGKFNPILLVFLCNIVVGSVGVFLTWKLTRS
jgi:lipopolysaccharide export system permease protein